MIQQQIAKWALNTLHGGGFTDSVEYEIGTIAAKEIKVINRTFQALGIKATVDFRNVTASDTGNFIRYPLIAYGKLSTINTVVDDLRVAVSSHRGIETDVALHNRYVLYLEMTYPLPSRPLEWRDAAIDGLQPFQALLGMDYTSTQPKPLVIDFGRRHIASGLIAGATGSGKTTLIASAITSLCHATSPADLQIVFVDPKRDEDWTALCGLPHVTMYNEPEACAVAIASVRAELERRKSQPDARKLILIIDEYADLRNTVYGDQVDGDIAAITAIGRSKNVHVLLATQKPTVEVVDTVAKGNLTTRIGGMVLTAKESEIAMGRGGIGCEHLPGMGSFYATIGGGRVQRLQSYLLEGEQLDAAIDGISARWGRVRPYRIEMTAEVQTAQPVGATGQDAELQRVLAEYAYEEIFDEDRNLQRGIKSEIAKFLFGDDATFSGTVQRTVNRVVKRLETEHTEPW